MGRTRTRETGWLAEQDSGNGPDTDLVLAARSALAQLPLDQRAAIALCLAGGWTHDEASAILKMPLGTVKSHVSRGRARLQEILGERDEER